VAKRVPECAVGSLVRGLVQPEAPHPPSKRQCAMARRQKNIQNLPVIEPNAAGADVGATQIVGGGARPSGPGTSSLF
jgi:hypothetical protein